MTPEQRTIIMQLRSVLLRRYDLDREEEQLLAALDPAPKRRRTPTLEEMRAGIRKACGEGERGKKR